MARGTKKDETAEREPGFESALERLEEIVERMEGGDLPLEEAMALFEEGVKLGQSCQKRLDEAERRITLLIEKADGALEEEEFDPDAPPAEAAPAPRKAASPSARPTRSSAPAAPRAAPAASPSAPKPPSRQVSWTGDDDAGGDIPF